MIVKKDECTMPKSKDQKDKDLKELTAKLAEAKGAVFSDYRGTTVKDLDAFRKALRKENVFAKVYKLTLVKKAMKQAGFEGEIADYKTPVILSLSAEDETTPARLVKNFTRDVKTISVLEGVLDKKVIGKAQVLALADLPSKQQMRAQAVRTINAPLEGFVNVLAGTIRGLLNVLNAKAAK
jgi:large subunit ribosomal protein L10